jgi:hypothetical protein
MHWIDALHEQLLARSDGRYAGQSRFDRIADLNCPTDEPNSAGSARFGAEDDARPGAEIRQSA